MPNVHYNPQKARELAEQATLCLKKARFYMGQAADYTNWGRSIDLMRESEKIAAIIRELKANFDLDTEI